MTFKAGDRVRHTEMRSFGTIIGTVGVFGEEWFRVRADDLFVYHAPTERLELISLDDSAVAQLRHLLGEISEALGMGSFTCTEAEAIFEIYDLVGMVDEAHAFMRTHAHDDSELEDDLHQLDETNENGWSYR